MDALEREAERATELSANMILGQLRSALVIKGAEVMLSRKQELADHEGINPFELIDHQWRSYKGACSGMLPEQGDWCFRTRTRKETDKIDKGWLIYNPGQPITIQGRSANAGEPLAWEVAAEFVDRNGNGLREQTESLTGLKLVPVTLTRDVDVR
ncbi:hypothetical protein [Marinobacter sp.]|uniref:hypothetical protein n=1 Tax=Marinobacter sp. TaxID=50741 RepID=UPI00384CC64B